MYAINTYLYTINTVEWGASEKMLRTPTAARLFVLYKTITFGILTQVPPGNSSCFGHRPLGNTFCSDYWCSTCKTTPLVPIMPSDCFLPPVSLRGSGHTRSISGARLPSRRSRRLRCHSLPSHREYTYETVVACGSWDDFLHDILLDFVVVVHHRIFSTEHRFSSDGWGGDDFL